MTRVWIGDDPDDLRRVRPTAERVSQIPRRLRLAEIVCSTQPGRPQLIAAAYPTGVTLDRVTLQTRGQDARLGDDINAPCRCPVQMHAVDGAALRDMVIASLGQRRPIVIDVRSVEATTGNDGLLA